MDENKLYVYNKGIALGYSPYWVLFAIDKGIYVISNAQGYYDFITWRIAKHVEFEPNTSKHYEQGYSIEFLEWLKRKVLA